MKAASRSTIEIWPKMKPCVKESLCPEDWLLVVCNKPVKQGSPHRTHAGSDLTGQTSCAMFSDLVTVDDGFAWWLEVV
jgi:hypothetical protein